MLIAFALLFAGVAAESTTEDIERRLHNHGTTDAPDPGTTDGTVSAAWSPRGLSLPALLALLVVMLTGPVAVSAESTTEIDRRLDGHGTTEAPDDGTTDGTVSGAAHNTAAGALLLSAAAAYVVN